MLMSSLLAFKPTSASHRHVRNVACSCEHVRVLNANRRQVLLSTSLALGSQVLGDAPALALTDRLANPPSGFNRHVDTLDAYSFVYPSQWSVVTSTGNDVFFTNPRVADENVFVAISSPSSSKYQSVKDLGSPEDASKRLEKQFLREFMSTRLGVRRTVEPISAVLRTGSDDKDYMDIVVRLKSYASRQQLAVNQDAIDDAIVLEFDRIAITTLGAANGRLYQFRIQTPYKRYTKDSSVFTNMTDSFLCWELDA